MTDEKKKTAQEQAAMPGRELHDLEGRELIDRPVVVVERLSIVEWAPSAEDPLEEVHVVFQTEHLPFVFAFRIKDVEGCDEFTRHLMASRIKVFGSDDAN